MRPDEMRKALGYLGWVIVACFLIVALAGAIQSNKGNSTIENIEEVPAAKAPAANTTAEKPITKTTPAKENKQTVTQIETTTSTDPRDNPAYLARVQQQQEDEGTSTPGETVAETTTEDTTTDNKDTSTYREPELSRTVNGLIVDPNGFAFVGKEYAGRAGNFTLS